MSADKLLKSTKESQYLKRIERNIILQTEKKYFYIPIGIFNLIFEFINEWRKFLKEPLENDPPKEIDIQSFFCKHNLLSFDINIDKGLVKKSFKPILESDWDLLAGEYHVLGNPVGFIHIEGLRLPDVETCEFCRMESLMNYENATITISRKAAIVISNDSKEYSIDEVQGHRRRRDGTLEFKIKWTGYAETTWEPETNIMAQSRLDYILNHYDNSFEEAIKTARLELEDSESVSSLIVEGVQCLNTGQGIVVDISDSDDIYSGKTSKSKKRSSPDTLVHDNEFESTTPVRKSNRKVTSRVEAEEGRYKSGGEVQSFTRSGGRSVKNIFANVTPTTTVKDIGIEILHQLFIPPLYQKLIFDNKILDDPTSTMRDLSIFNGAVLTLEVFDESTGAFDCSSLPPSKEIGFVGTNLVGSSSSKTIFKSNDDNLIDLKSIFRFNI
jgi:hypothetical protein